MTKSIIKRYTPPTCTLEIRGKKSPLSRIFGRTLLKDLNFQLRFDDPRIPEENQVILEGDRTQLELLSDAVTSYVQKFLSSPPISITETESNNSLVLLPTNPNLKQRSLLKHQLFFGSLATKESGPEIKLNASQLFDLANALDEYNSDLATLPEANYAGNRNNFLGVTAASLLLAVGLTTLGIKVFNRENNSEKNSSVVSLQETAPKPKIEPIPTLTPQPATTTVPTPSLPPPLASSDRLAPPEAVKPPNPPTPTPVEPIIPPPPPSPPPTARETITIEPSAPSLPPPPPPIVTFDNTGVTPELPKLPPLESNASEITDAGTPETIVDKSDSLTAFNEENKLNTLPQLLEAQEYFQTRWQPPETLEQSLQYSIVLNNDGSIGRIIPLGQASQLYLDRTGMPLMGESFVSPLPSEGNFKIRLVLTPDGKVQTFLEN